jgi:glycine/serine hydroxymethyltransferase
VYLDVSYSLIPFDIQAIRKAIGKNILVYDASHTMGLMLGGAFPNPLKQGADIITANTHKTLPGSHKGMILFADEELYKTTDARAHAYYSSIHLDHLMTLCITINEMMEFGADYSKKVVDNANLLGDLLTKRGLTCRRGDDKQWTHTHQLHLLTTGLGEPKDLAKRFFDNNMAISFDNRYHQGFFIRFGLQEITRRGADAKEIELLADAIAGAIKGNDVKGLVSSINTALGSSVRYSFDTPTANS